MIEYGVCHVNKLHMDVEKLKAFAVKRKKVEGYMAEIFPFCPGLWVLELQ